MLGDHQMRSAPGGGGSKHRSRDVLKSISGEHLHHHHRPLNNWRGRRATSAPLSLVTFFRTVPTGNYHCCELSAPPSGDVGGHFLGRLDKGSWLQALEVRVVLIPGDPRRGKPDPEYGIAIRVKSQLGAEDGVAWVNVSRRTMAYAWLCECVTVAMDVGEHADIKSYCCSMIDLLPLDEMEEEEINLWISAGARPEFGARSDAR
jgi:hypothetical protein